jgi:CMP-N,N'-diacetyllegionaminic acid synthase
VIGSSTILALVPARGGSKGVPRKNIRVIGGKPMIAWTIEAARASRYIDQLVLSSDDPAIMDIAIECGCEVPFVRPAELASDQADAMSVIRHAIDTLPERFDYVVLLQPTSPMRRTQDIDAAIERCVASGAPACVSICEAEKSPFWMLELDAKGIVHPLFPADQIPHRRQDARAVFALNGAVYVARTDHLRLGGTFLAPGAIGYPMPKERSLDVDTELDLAIADFLLQRACNEASRQRQ